jgi:hypothetical protein
VYSKAEEWKAGRTSAAISANVSASGRRFRRKYDASDACAKAMAQQRASATGAMSMDRSVRALPLQKNPSVDETVLIANQQSVSLRRTPGWQRCNRARSPKYVMS